MLLFKWGNLSFIVTNAIIFRSHPGSSYGRRQQGSRPGSQARSRPGSRAGSRAGSRSGSQPGSRPGSSASKEAEGLNLMRGVIDACVDRLEIERSAQEDPSNLTRGG